MNPVLQWASKIRSVFTMIRHKTQDVKENMTGKKIILFSLLGGCLLSLLGFSMIAIGGWGPCGPTSRLAQVGGYLNVEHVIFLSTWLGEIPTPYPFIDLIIILLIPSLDWTIGLMLILLLVRKIKSMRQHHSTGKVFPKNQT